jgi:hypothetical protein
MVKNRTKHPVSKTRKYFAELVQVIDDSSPALIMPEAENDSKKALQILRDHYLQKGKPRIISLYMELSPMTKATNESVTDYVIRAETAAAQLRDTGESMSDGLLVAKVVKGLPREYHSFITVNKRHLFLISNVS